MDACMDGSVVGYTVGLLGLIRWMFAWVGGCPAGRLAHSLVVCMGGCLPSWAVGSFVGCLIGRLIGWLVSVVWWLSGWLVVLFGWFDGCLVACLHACLID